MNPLLLSWWYDDAAYHSDRSTLILACLIPFGDGTSAVSYQNLFQRFASLDEARCWLADEEFAPIETLLEEYGLQVSLPERCT